MFLIMYSGVGWVWQVIYKNLKPMRLTKPSFNRNGSWLSGSRAKLTGVTRLIHSLSTLGPNMKLFVLTMAAPGTWYVFQGSYTMLSDSLRVIQAVELSSWHTLARMLLQASTVAFINVSTITRHASLIENSQDCLSLAPINLWNQITDN